MLTLSAAQSSRLQRVSGFVPSSQDFIDLLNDATRELMRRGSWVATTRRMCACVYNGCVTWPRQVHSVLALNTRHGSAMVRNSWYGFSNISRQEGEYFRRNQCPTGDLALVEGNLSSVFNPINPAAPKYLRFYPTENGDIGKTVRVFGVDSTGQNLFGLRPDGSFQDGLVLKLASPYVQTPMLIHRIDHILKDATQGPVRGFQWDGTSLWPLCYYEPTETAPEYRTSTIQGMNLGACCGASPQRISALVKLSFIPVQHADDIVLIHNIDALCYAVQAIKYGDGGDADSREKFLAMAIAELNMEIWGREEDNDLVVSNNVLGGTGIGRQQCF